MDMLNRCVNILLASLFLLMSQLVQAQAVRVKATANKDHILIGEPILLQLEAEGPAGTAINWFALDSIPHFEFIETGKIDTVPGSMGVLIKQVITITSFDSGRQVIPQLAAGFNNSRYLTDSIAVDVAYSTTDTNQPYHDIKDIIEVAAVEPLYVNYIIAVITILAIVALIWLLRKKKEHAVVTKPGKSLLPPYETALASLSELDAARLPEKGQYKLFGVTLNEILRTYCREEKIGALPDTDNMRLVVELKSLLEKDNLLELAQELRLLDAVKFARFEPSREEQQKLFTVVSTAIAQIHNNLHKKAAV